MTYTYKISVRLALCYAAVASAERGEAIVPGSVRQLPNDI